MIRILAEVPIDDLARFTEVFSTAGLEVRGKDGCLKSRIYMIEQNEKTIYVSRTGGGICRLNRNGNKTLRIILS